MTAPAFISIKTSSIPNAGMGAFAEACIPVGMVFGPYQGLLIDDAADAEKDGYCWELRSHTGAHFIDGSNTQYSNWMRYINSSRRECFATDLCFSSVLQLEIRLRKVRGKCLPYHSSSAF
ncbi:unnamed protein product [Nippostrongylus brasiliensis]|uniref:SET domain-containing protein n=1 Tax=Nippostrongylus brasiliensis TaxID=27835 RepID=A0A0N4YND6_NIPBR|nr:unnamed protein product [Nippostrongylus brasiliensis]